MCIYIYMCVHAYAHMYIYIYMHLHVVLDDLLTISFLAHAREG